MRQNHDQPDDGGFGQNAATWEDYFTVNCTRHILSQILCVCACVPVYGCSLWINASHMNISFVASFYARSRNCEKWLLASSCPVNPSAWDNSFSTGRILIKFDVWVLENLSRKLKFFFKMGKNKEHFIGRRFHIYDDIFLNSYWNEKYSK